MTPRFRTVLIAVVAAAALVALVRAALPGAKPADDFLRYDRAAALVWQGRGDALYDDLQQAFPEEELSGQRYRYNPGLSVSLAPMGGLPPRTAWALWSAACAALTFGGAGLAVALALRRLRPGVPVWIPVAALVPLVGLFLENIKLGQMNCWAFGLSMGALWALDRGRDRAAGLLVAGATVAKHIPALLVLWFLWQRRWKAVLWCAAGGLFLVYLLPTAVFGPARHHRLIGDWMAQENKLVTEVDEAPGMRASGPAEHVEGQSVKALLYRYLTPTSFFHLRSVTKKGPVLGKGPTGISVNGGRMWSPVLVFRLWLLGVLAVLCLVVIASGPIPGEDPARAALRYPLGAGVMLAAILLCSPESRNPHFQMLAPGLAALAAGLASEERRGGSWWGRAGLAGAGALLIGISTQGVLRWVTGGAAEGRAAADQLLAHGSIGFGCILVFASLLWTLFRERRAP